MKSNSYCRGENTRGDDNSRKLIVAAYIFINSHKQEVL